jgi:hypothetical protein
VSVGLVSKACGTKQQHRHLPRAQAVEVGLEQPCSCRQVGRQAGAESS